jgi:nudix-type nucleoside diphosphatase (YffH/AdpP family)
MQEVGQEVLRAETAFAGWLKVIRLHLRTRTGAEIEREVLERGNAATVLPYDPDRRTALLVRLPRPAATWGGGPPDLLEAPAGMIDAGETGEDAARREALEEAGVKLGPLERIASTWPSPGASSERVDLFLAACSVSDRVGAGGGVEGEHEDIVVVETLLSELWGLVERGGIHDLKTLALVLALKTRRPELF